MSDFNFTSFDFAGNFGPIGRSENYQIAVPSWDDDLERAEVLFTENSLKIESDTCQEDKPQVELKPTTDAHC